MRVAYKASFYATKAEIPLHHRQIVAVFASEFEDEDLVVALNYISISRRTRPDRCYLDHNELFWFTISLQ